MKKYNVFKVLLLTLLVAIVISFLIPQSQLGYNGIEKGVINPITLWDSVSNGLTSFSVFIASFVYILSIGILYSVLKKSEKYDAVITNTAAKFKKKGVFIVISVSTFGLLTALIGSLMPMLMFVPAFIDIAKKMGYDSKRAILATVGAMILGLAGSLNTNYANQILGTTVSSNIFVKLIALVISLTLLILFTVIKANPKDTKLEKVKVKKGLLISIAFDVLLVLVILGTVSWNTYFGFDGFNSFHQTITEFKVFDVSLFNVILGKTFEAFGTWTTYSLILLVMTVSMVLAIIFKLKINGTIEAISNGVKKALPYALILVLSNLILVAVYNSGFFTTVIDSIARMKDSVLSGTTVSALSAVAYPDYTYASQFTLSTFSTVISNTDINLVLAVIFQLIYSLVLLISPTSIILLMALRYEDVRYKDWIKYIYKFFLALLIIFFVIIIIVGFKQVKAVSYIVLGVLAVILALFIILSLTKGKKTTKKVKNDE